MPTFRKFFVLAVAHAMLLGGCAAQLGRGEPGLSEEDGEVADELVAGEGNDAVDEGPSPERPAGLFYEGHEGVAQVGLEQWLTFVDLETGEPIEALTVCEPALAEDDEAACAETDATGAVITHWTPADESYRMLGTLPDGTSFVLSEVAASDLINRLLRPIGVMNGTELEAAYAAAEVKLEAGRYTVLARARTGEAVADDVRFTLHALGCEGALADAGCTGETVAEGKEEALTAQAANLGHGMFLDVVPGVYELRGERDGVACSHAELRLDGESSQVIAPELACP